VLVTVSRTPPDFVILVALKEAWRSEEEEE
jgi:hypothetical protein